MPRDPKKDPIPERREPPQLARGRAHDREQKAAWNLEALDIELHQRPGLEKYSSGRRGFTDIRGRVGSGSDGVIVEVKSDDLDRLSDTALRRRIVKYVAQIEDYMYSPTHRYETVQGAVQFQRRPTIPGRAEAIEDAFNDHGITCVWLDA